MSVLDSHSNASQVKKRRIARACDGCRQRKVKCDGDEKPNNVCTNCIIDNALCTYTRSAPKRGPTKEYVQALEERAANADKMELYLLRTMSKERFEQEFNFKPVVDTSLDTHDITFANLDDDPDDLADGLGMLNLHGEIKHLETRYFGKSSSATLVRTALNAKRDGSHPTADVPATSNYHIPENLRASVRAWATPLPWEISRQHQRPKYSFPPPDLMWSLIDYFFIHCNLLFPLLHRPTFERQVKERFHEVNDAFGANLLLVCACGSRFSTDPRAYLEEYDLHPQSAGWKWFRQVQVFKDSLLHTPDLLDVQFYCLAILFMAATSSGPVCWLVTGLGIRLAQDVGADRKKNRQNSVENEQWRRAWWLLVTFDRLMSATMGRQIAVKDQDFDQTLPSDCDDEFWENDDPQLAFKQPEGVPSKTSAFIHLIGLARILGVVLVNLYPTRKPALEGSRVQQIVADLDSAMNLWLQNLPDHIRWDPQRENSVLFHLSVTLHSVFYSLQILIHRQFLPPLESDASQPFPSMAICVNAARSCARMLDVQRRRMLATAEGLRIPTQVFPWCQGMARTSGIVLLLSLWVGRKVGQALNYQREMEDVQKCIDYLTFCQPLWKVSSVFIATLTDIAAVGDIQLLDPSGIPGGRKRTWDENASQSSSESNFMLPRETPPEPQPASPAFDLLQFANPANLDPLLTVYNNFGSAGSMGLYSHPDISQFFSRSMPSLSGSLDEELHQTPGRELFSDSSNVLPDSSYAVIDWDTYLDDLIAITNRAPPS